MKIGWSSRGSRPSASDFAGVDVFLRRRSRRKWYVLVAIVIALALAWADRSGYLRPRDSDLSRYDGKTFLVVHVVDGDTLDVDAADPNGKEGLRNKTRIRMWGINAPEMPHHGREIEPYAQEATDFLRARADGQRVTLTLEPHRVRDVYGRLLAFVRVSDGGSLNEALIAAGFARADGRWEHRYLRRYSLIEEQAKRDGAGLWASEKKSPFQPRSSPTKSASRTKPSKSTPSRASENGGGSTARAPEPVGVNETADDTRDGEP